LTHARVYCGAEIAAGEPEPNVDRIPHKAFVRSDEGLNDLNREAVYANRSGNEERWLAVIRRLQRLAQWVTNEGECHNAV